MTCCILQASHQPACCEALLACAAKWQGFFAVVQVLCVIAVVVLAGQENKDAGLGLTDKQAAKLYSLQKQVADVRGSHDTFAEVFAAYAVQMDDFRLATHQPNPQVTCPCTLSVDICMPMLRCQHYVKHSPLLWYEDTG